MTILPDFVAFDANGLYCKYGDFYLDPQQPVTHAVITHAHADHAISGNNHIYATDATIAFMQLRYAKTTARVINKIAFDAPFTIGGVEITLVPAGHILGSAQVLMEYQGVRYLYTGDYKLQPDATCEAIEWVKADVLITESTFADPQVVHPDPIEEIGKLNNIKTNILLGAYSLGKAQRLIRLINDHAPQKKILLHHRVMAINAVYERFKYSPGKYQVYGRKLMKTQEEWVYIVPPFTFDSYFNAVGVTRLFASGWKNLQVNKNDTLFISDHVDWDDILLTIAKVRPTEVWTLHGNGIHLKNHFAETIFVKMLN